MVFLLEKKRNVFLRGRSCISVEIGFCFRLFVLDRSDQKKESTFDTYLGGLDVF